jgi:type IV pilus assembly protein PilM
MSKRILALDVGASTIKLAEFHVQKDHSLELVNYGTRPIGLDPQDEGNRMVYTGAALDELMQEQRIKPGPVLLSVSGQHVFYRYVKLPPVAGDKIAQVVEYEAKQNVPNIDEVVWDRQILPTPGGEMDVLLAAIKADVVENLAETVHNSGLETELVDISIAALYNAYRHNEPAREGCTMILDMGARTSNVIFAEGERVWSRSFPVSGNSITQQIARDFEVSFGEAEKMKESVSMVALGGAYEPLEDAEADQVSKCIRGAMTRLHAEITRSISTYRSQQNGQAPDRVLLTGGSSVMQYLDIFLKEKLGIPVEYFNPLQNITVSENIEEDRLASDWHLLSEVVGLALRKVATCAISLNLLPPSIARERIFRKKQGFLVASCFLLAAILGVWGLHASGRTKALGADRDLLQTEVEDLENWKRRIAGVSQAYTQQEQNLMAITNVVTERVVWLRILEDVRQRMPEGVWIAQIKPDETMPRQKLVLIGTFFKDKVYANLQRPDNSRIVKFQEELKDSPWFGPETKFTVSTTDVPDTTGAMRRNVAAFQIELVLEKPLPL